MLIAVIIIALIAGGFFLFKGSKPLAILPELDNRINYWDVNTDATQLVTIGADSSGTYAENDKFNCAWKGGELFFEPTRISMSTFSESHYISCRTKKNFRELQIFLRVSRAGGNVEVGGVGLPSQGDYIWTNYEIQPDNLNPDIYDVSINGEFWKRIESKDMSINFAVSNINTRLFADYIKYIPREVFTVKSDEVWVKEVRGSDYYYSNLNWEMIGFHSQIRPATIRDLTAQTEVPAPQIYVSLINNLPVTVQPNTVHTFYYRTKWTQGLDSSCQGNLDQVEIKQPDGIWKCESFVKETPIIQQCQNKADCPILPDCEAQRDLIECNNNLCDFSAFSPACKNQLITYQEKVVEIEKTKFVPIISGTNSFYCFFTKEKPSCNVGEKTISVVSPSYVCALPSGSQLPSSSPDCWQSSLTFNEQSYQIKGEQILNNIGFNIKSETSISTSLNNNILRDEWSIVGKFTLPDNFLDIKPKTLGNKFVLQNSNEPVTFTITNNLGFGIDGGYTIQTQNLALEGGVILRDETKELFLKSGDTDITYDFTTSKLGNIVDIIGDFGKVTTDREYILKSSQNGIQKSLVVNKEIVISLPQDIEKVQPKIITKEIIVEKPIFKEVVKEKIPAWVGWGIAILLLIVIGYSIWRRYNRW